MQIYFLFSRYFSRRWLPNLFFVILLLQEDLFLTLNLVAQLLFSGQESQVLSCIDMLLVTPSL